MSVVPNSDAFALACRRLQGDYEELFRHRIADVRAKFGDGLSAGERAAAADIVEQALEAHARAYVINGVLGALNWRIGSLPQDGVGDLIPEAPVYSVSTETTRFLDYLGLERHTHRPLLIVETKRPSSTLPAPAGRGRRRVGARSEVVSLGLRGDAISGDWGSWLSDLRDYVRTAATRSGIYPRRALITNGAWFVVFLDPEDSFALNGTMDPGRILVIENADDLQAQAGELFMALAHRYVSYSAPPLTVGQVPLAVAAEHIRGGMHGVRLRYSEQREVYQTLPSVFVAPVLFIRLLNGTWIRIEAPPQNFELPHAPDSLSDHLRDVRAAAEALIANVRAALNVDVTAVSLEDHYADDAAFAALKGVEQSAPDEFVIATGTATHYLLETPTVPACPFHDSGRAAQVGVVAEPLLLMRSTTPRAFFVSGEPHHCAHRVVADAKAAVITAANLAVRGPRSGSNGQAFCELFRFETRLCCRTCAFESVCTKAQALAIMPCTRPRQ